MYCCFVGIGGSRKNFTPSHIAAVLKKSPGVIFGVRF
nr:MAG TPA: hypothetical protein [Caudoviricetes sp.]